jgi:hypothetical protein
LSFSPSPHFSSPLICATAIIKFRCQLLLQLLLLNICNWRSRGNCLCNFRSCLRACVGESYRVCASSSSKTFRKAEILRWEELINTSSTKYEFQSNIDQLQQQFPQCPKSAMSKFKPLSNRNVFHGPSRGPRYDFLLRHTDTYICSEIIRLIKYENKIRTGPIRLKTCT